jgi:hypothetical protein
MNILSKNYENEERELVKRATERGVEFEDIARIKLSITNGENDFPTIESFERFRKILTLGE